MDEDLRAALEEQYCPPIDPALLSAILSDFDLSKPEDLQTAHTTLDELKESAVLEAAAGFDASGTGGLDESVDSDRSDAGQLHADPTQSRGTERSSLSNEMSSLDLGDDGSDTHDAPEEVNLESLDDETKIKLLRDLFGKHVSQYSIEYTLRKCNGRWEAAMDELLNHVYFGEDPANAKGIDGFFEDNHVRRGRKGRSKNNRGKQMGERRSGSTTESQEASPAPATNRWKTAAEDVEFIASRMGIKSATVTSMYYEAGASIPKTIAALLRVSREESKALALDSKIESSRAEELASEFPTVSADDLHTIVRLTHPSTITARELTEALTTKSPSMLGGIQLLPSYSKPSDLDEVDDWIYTAPTSRSTASSPHPSSDLRSSIARRDAYDLARAAAISQAQAARRKAKSNPLMNGAIAVYSQNARESGALSARASARVADDIAAKQSTSTQVDLHGIDVANGVRIALDRVEEWWEGLGESRVNGRVGVGERQAGYRIIVGIGRHSEGGRGKLGPAVSKALREQGWRVEPCGGVIVVRGPSRK
ncbi:hypothetical protein BDY17DRAFT_252220 [Neohortaea acidophila]|uniref:Smr domain-containing protein n=1 Tax=Neohortaea acidophila TaxID=245834 RepID=A0A6A6PRY6_9PEZI|nr:uncharacterized protein BDY17DRAFT_252220 [Neohortaea acidophila]KAF2482441.1 hypothetical protein BDY17DRAFT_252220 [Neohortaea acidophila]